MWRWLVAAVLIVHGLVHLIGFVVPWRLATLADFPYRTTVFSGMEVGSAAVRTVGVLWLLAAVGFVVAGAGLLTGASWWTAGTVAAAGLSVVLAALWAQQAFAGLVIDAALLAGLLASSAFRDLAA